jgi:hypothetical protein
LLAGDCRPRFDARVEERVRPPSLGAEARFVAKALFHVGYWSLFVVFAHPRAAAAEAMLPFERRFSDLDVEEQRLVRNIREGLVEAEARRGKSGAWPAPEVLAAAQIPPFSNDPLDRAGYAWRLAETKGVVNYVGIPKDEKKEAFVVVVTEPAPGTPPDPQVQEDEIHHRLSTGTMIHVGTWMGPRVDAARLPLVAPNPDEGFRQLLVGPVRR